MVRRAHQGPCGLHECPLVGTAYDRLCLHGKAVPSPLPTLVLADWLGPSGRLARLGGPRANQARQSYHDRHAGVLRAGRL